MNAKWQAYIDFANLKKACLKDSFPLSKIDMMVDAIAKHELLSFMNAYFKYNQITMHPNDQGETLFITVKDIYYYKVMPFGLKNVGAIYRRLVNVMFLEYIGSSMEVYNDDILMKLL